MKSPAKKTILFVLSAAIGVIGVAQGLHWADLVSSSTALTITGALGLLATVLHAIASDETGGSNTMQASPLVSLLGLAVLVSLLAGCSSSNWANGVSGGLTNFFGGVNQITATMNTPAGQQAIASLKASYRGVVCGVAAGSSFVSQIAVDVKATRTVANTQIVMAVSDTLCTSAGGVVGS